MADDCKRKYFFLPVLSRERFLPISWKIGQRQVSQNSLGWLVEWQRGHRLDIRHDNLNYYDTLIDSYATVLTREHSMNLSYIFSVIFSWWQILPLQRLQVPTVRGVSSGVPVILISLLEIVLILLIIDCYLNITYLVLAEYKILAISLRES